MKNIFLALLFIPIALTAQKTPTESELRAMVLSQNLGFETSDLAEFQITSSTYDHSNGLTHVYLNQKFRGIPVYNAVMGIHLDRQGNLVTLNHSFLKNLNALKSETAWLLGVEEAFSYAYNLKTSYNLLSKSFHFSETVSSGFLEFKFHDERFSSEDITVSKVWFPSDHEIIAAWNVNWMTSDGENWWNIRLNANDGNFLDENNWVSHCKAETSGSSDGHKCDLPGQGEGLGGGMGKTSAQYNVIPRPIESPSHGDRALLKDPSDSLSSPYSWHDIDGKAGAEYTITRGNNVYAKEDKDKNNTGGYSPDGGSSLSFDFPFDKTKRHSDYLDAAITNLFYWNNLMHDVWYHYGFDDPSGNFQVNNYGRGGSGNDEVNADAQDGNGTNNANFATPPDGQKPRMQMYVWNVSSLSTLLKVSSPSSVAKKYTAVAAVFGPMLTTTPINGNLVLVNDGSSTPTLGCSAPVNSSDINGQIAVIDRGSTCTYVDKVMLAQAAGAKAVIIINNTTGNPVTMSGTGGGSISIPSIMITKADGDLLKNAMKTATVSASLYDSLGSSGKQYDSDFDNGVISHEYGHGISNRLTGGPQNTNCLTNQEQMGEGWSDFFALVMTHKPGSKGIDKRGIGTYVSDQATDGGGIRNYPYSTSMTINPVTYENIKTFSVPHGVGSVWCSMLWDMYWDMIAKHGYDPDVYNGKGGNNKAMKLVIDGLKLQPCNPGFTDGRDAILLADRMNNGGANQDLIWKAFARRGLGYGAIQGSANNRTDGVQSFVVPTFNLPAISKLAKPLSQQGDTLVYSITLKNNNVTTIKQVTLSDTLKSGLAFIKAEGYAKGVFNNNIYTAFFDSLKADESVTVSIYTKVTASNSSFIETTDFENGPGMWKDSTLAGSGNWVSRSNKQNSGTKCYYMATVGAVSDKVLMKKFDLKISNPHLVFYHLYNTEAGWDGAVIEINKDGTWEDLGSQMIENGYNNTIAVNPASNISGQAAFTGNAVSFIRTVIDLTPYQGDSARIRFRLVTDAAGGIEGWYVDDISLVSNYSAVKNTAYVSEPKGSSLKSGITTMLKSDGTVNVKSISGSGFAVFPNPFNEKFFIQSSHQNYSYTLTDIYGRLIQSHSKASKNSQIETTALAKGTYVLKLETPMGTSTFKLIKQ